MKDPKEWCAVWMLLFFIHIFIYLPATLHLAVVLLICAPFPFYPFHHRSKSINSGWLFLLSWLLLLRTVCALVPLANVAGKIIACEHRLYDDYCVCVFMYAYMGIFKLSCTQWIMQLSRFTTAAIGWNYRGQLMTELNCEKINGLWLEIVNAKFKYRGYFFKYI